MNKKLFGISLSVILVIAMLSTSALAFSSDHTAVSPNHTNIDVLIAADNTYSGDINEFADQLKAALGDMGSISDTVNVSKVQSNVSLANFDDWYVYDHYYHPDYPADGSIPADWNDFAGKHPYDYYKESDYQYPMSAILSAELVLHDTLWPAYTTAVADLSTFGNRDYLYRYTAEKYPYKNLSDSEKTALEPLIVAGINARWGTAFASLSEYYTYIAGNESYYNGYYFLPAYGELVYPTLSDTEKNNMIHDFYYDRYIASYWSNAYSSIWNYIYDHFSESDLFVTDITSPGNMDWVYLRDKHIYTSIDKENNADITFMGYSAPAYKDFLIYPMDAGSQKTVNFDIDASKVYTHTLEGAGFLINAGIDESGYIKGYILYYKFDAQTNGTVYLLKIKDGVLANTLHNEAYYSLLSYTTTLSSQPFQFNTDSMKKNIDITISSEAVTCVDTDYVDDTTLSEGGVTLFGETKALDDIGVYGYGPITGYSSHGCSEISAFTFNNLKMKYESSSVTVLRGATYVGAAKKVYIILTDTPETDTSSESYYELLTRLVQDQIFYVTGGGPAIFTATGGNGLDISGSSNQVADVAAYLESIYNGTTVWNAQQPEYPLDDLLPVAIFDVLDTKGDQILTIDQKHIGTDSITLTFGNLDKSIALASGASDLEYHFAVYDPNGQPMTLGGEGNNEITMDSSSAYGTYTFELTVSHGFTDPDDNRELTSVAATRQLIVLNDTTPPAVTRVDSSATPHTGSIITLDLSDSESGVAAYAIGKAIGSAEPVYEDEVVLDQPVASKQIVIPTENKDFTLYVKVYDGCGNELIWSVAHAADSVSDYKIVASAGIGGTIDPSGSIEIEAHSDKKYTITPSKGYEISDVLVDGVSVGKVTEYSFSDITENHTITAFFVLHTSVCPSKPFTDVDTTRWYHESIDYVLLAGLFKGTSATTFQPCSGMTRAMLVVVLHRLEGVPAVSEDNPFTDVASGKWYTDAIAWASAKGIIKGYSPQIFGPGDFITREQLATILFRYAQYKGYDVSVGEDTNILSYKDAADISKYALPAIQWACGAGIMQGDGVKLEPQGNATRAQAAAMLMRFIENAVE